MATLLPAYRQWMFVVLLAAASIGAVRAQYSRSNKPAEKNSAATPLHVEPLHVEQLHVEQLHVEMVKTGLFLISGGGSNSVLRLSANGSIILDGKAPGSYEALVDRFGDSVTI